MKSVCVCVLQFYSCLVCFWPSVCHVNTSTFSIIYYFIYIYIKRYNYYRILNFGFLFTSTDFGKINKLTLAYCYNYSHVHRKCKRGWVIIRHEYFTRDPPKCHLPQPSPSPKSCVLLPNPSFFSHHNNNLFLFYFIFIL